MPFRKLALAFTVVLIVIAAGGAVWMWNAQHRLYSNPAAARTNDSYLRAHAPAIPRLPAPTNFFDSIRVAQTEEEITVSVPASPEHYSIADYEPLQVHEADSTHTVRVGEGSVRLALIATGHQAVDEQRGAEIPLRLYSPDLKPATTNETRGLLPRHEIKTYVHSDWPVARFFFAVSNAPELKPHRLAVFDARTRWPMVYRYSSAQLPNLIWFETTYQGWHQAPLEMVATFLSGPEQIFSLPAQPGAEMRGAGCHLRVLAAAEGWSSSSGTSGDGSTNRHSVQLSLEPSWDKKPRCIFVLHGTFPGDRLAPKATVTRDGFH